MIGKTGLFYLDSFPTKGELSISRLHGKKFNGNVPYDKVIADFWKDIGTDIVFYTHNDNDRTEVTENLSQQYDHTYMSGLNTNISPGVYAEEYEFFAPLYINPDSLPDCFIIFRLDGPGLIDLNRTNWRAEWLSHLKPIHYVDLKENSPVGDWMKLSFTDRIDFPVTGLEVNFSGMEFTRWHGIDLRTGGHTNRPVFMEKQFSSDNLLSESESLFTEFYMTNEIIHPHILNLSYLFDDSPATGPEIKNWSLNRYCGFYFDEKDNYWNLHSYELPALRTDVIIGQGNILSSPSSDNPFISETTEGPLWIEINGTFYRITKFDEPQPISIIRQRMDDNIETEVIGRPFVTRYRVISDIDLSGTTYVSMNKRTLFIGPDGLLIDPTTDLPHIIPGADDTDLNMILIGGKWFRLVSGPVPGSFRILSDYEFTVNVGGTLTAVAGGDIISINLKLSDDTPEPFHIYRFRFTEVRDFDTMVIDNDFSRYEYESGELVETSTEEPKMYLPELRSGKSPIPFDDFRINGRTGLIPVASDYTSTLETFSIRDGELNGLWNRNPLSIRFGYQNSNSIADRPYLLNNNTVHGVWNRTVNTDNIIPERQERNMDHFYTFLPGTTSYVHHSLHIDRSPHDPYVRMDIGQLTGLGTYSPGVNYVHDHHDEIVSQSTVFLDGVFTRTRDRRSYFNKGETGVPDTTVFKGIRYRAYETEGTSYDGDKVITEIRPGRSLGDYSFMSVLTCNDERVSDDGMLEPTYLTGQWISASSSGGVTEFLVATYTPIGVIEFGLFTGNVGSWTQPGYNVLELEYPPGQFTIAEVFVGPIPGGWGFTTNLTGPQMTGPGGYRNKMQWNPIMEFNTGQSYEPGDFIISEWRIYEVVSATTVSDPNFDPAVSNPDIIPFPGASPVPGQNYDGWGGYDWFQYFSHPMYDDSLFAANYYDETNPPLFDPSILIPTGLNWTYIYGEYYTYINSTDPNPATFWSTVTTYQVGDIVLYVNKMYESTDINTNQSPSTHPGVWNEIPFDSNRSFWRIIPLWSPVTYPTDSLVVKEDVLYWNSSGGPVGGDKVPGQDSEWEFVYTFNPIKGYRYPRDGKNFIPIMKMGEDFCIITYNLPKLILDSGLTVYVDHRHGTVTHNIYINDNTLFSDITVPDRTRNMDRDHMYVTHNTRVTGMNVIRQLNDLENLYGFINHTTYVITNVNGEVSVHNINSGIEELPLLLLSEEPELFEYNGDGTEVSIPNTPSIKSRRKLISGQINTVDQIDDYNDNVLSVGLTVRPAEDTPSVSYNSQSISEENNLRRFSGYYAPVTYPVELFRSPYLSEGQDGKLKYYGKGWVFDEELCLFGHMRQRISQKYSKITNVLQLTNDPSNPSIYPMLDETGLMVSDFNIFKSTWDHKYHLSVSLLTDKSRTSRPDILRETIIQRSQQ